jgi:hypothetical protein
MRAVLSLRVTLLTLALVVAVVVPCTAVDSSFPGGASSSSVGAGAGGGHLLSQAWNWLKALWPAAGCLIDPNGRRCATPAPPAARLDEGCLLDPNGKCPNSAGPVAAPRPDEGCMLDPDGRCRASASPTLAVRKR